MPDDKSKDEVGGVKDRLSDEFNEAAGTKDKKSKKGDDKNPDGVKDRVKDEFDKATGKDKKDKDS